MYYDDWNEKYVLERPKKRIKKEVEGIVLTESLLDFFYQILAEPSVKEKDNLLSRKFSPKENRLTCIEDDIERYCFRSMKEDKKTIFLTDRGLAYRPKKEHLKEKMFNDTIDEIEDSIITFAVNKSLDIYKDLKKCDKSRPTKKQIETILLCNTHYGYRPYKEIIEIVIKTIYAEDGARKNTYKKALNLKYFGNEEKNDLSDSIKFLSNFRKNVSEEEEYLSFLNKLESSFNNKLSGL